MGASIAEVDALTDGDPLVGYLTAVLVPGRGVQHVSDAVELSADTDGTWMSEPASSWSRVKADRIQVRAITAAPRRSGGSTLPR
jgi:hypothetical protein